jgi:Type II secretion system (T2SS), protein E, N-terminal domain
VPKTLGEIAIEAGLVNKAGAARAGKMAEEQGQPLVVVLVRESGVDELALVGALRKQTRVPLLDPADLQIDPEALRQLPRDVCARLRVLPLGVGNDGQTKVLRLAMADPTDTAAVAEIEQLTRAEIDVSALPLSAIEELVDRGYRQINTAVVNRSGTGGQSMFVTSKGKITGAADVSEQEVSVTAQIPLASLRPVPDDAETRLNALIAVLVGKGLITEAELAEALRKLKGTGS